MVKRFAIGLYRKLHQMGLNFCPLRSRMCTFILLSGGGRDGMEFGCRAGLIAYDQFGGSRSREPCLLNQIALIICDNGVFLHGKKYSMDFLNNDPKSRIVDLGTQKSASV